MLFEDTYKTIEQVSEGLFKDRGSKFIAFAYPVKNDIEIKESLAQVKKEHFNARHFCYAYRLGFDKTVYRVNDDGEPSGTAGKPIYGQILSNDLTNVLVVVVRYFGGTKLGVSGLINAYRSATKDALSKTVILTKTINDVFEVIFNYPELNGVMKIVKEENLIQHFQDFEMICKIRLEVRKKNAERVYGRFSKISNLKINNLSTF